MMFDIKLQIRDIKSKRTIFKSAGVLVNYVKRDYWDPPGHQNRDYWEVCRTSVIRYKAVNSEIN